MQVVEITSLTGHSPYNISICDLTLTYCYVVATGVVSVPPTLSLNIPTELDGADQVLVVVTDSIGCQEFILQSCPGTPTPTPTLTPTPTITRIVICNCISFENTTSGSLNFHFTQCNDVVFNGTVQSGTTLYYCGRLPSADVGVNIQINEECVSNTCTSLTPTPTQTPTLTQTLPTVVGYFQDSCNPLNTFIVSNIPLSYSPLSGVYYIQSSGYIGCATAISPITSSNVYSYILLNSQPDVNTCQILNPCPTPTPTPTPTLTTTPTQTPTNTLTTTPTQTPTNTPTSTFIPTYSIAILSYSATICGVPNWDFSSLGIGDVKCYFTKAFNPVVQINGAGFYYYSNIGFNVGTQFYDSFGVPEVFTGNYVYGPNSYPSNPNISTPPLYVVTVVNGVITIITNFDDIPACGTFICPTPTPTPTPTLTQTPTLTPTPSSAGLVLELFGCCDLTTQYVEYNPILVASLPAVYTSTIGEPYEIVTGLAISGTPTRVITDFTNYTDCGTWIIVFGSCP